MTQNVGQAVLAGVGDLLPVLRDRAQEAEDQREVPADSIKALAGTGFFRLLQPGGVRRPGGRPAHLPDRGQADRQRLRLHRLGGLGARRAPVAARAVPAAGPGGGLGRRPGDPDVRPPTRRPAGPPPSTAVTCSAAGGASPPAARTPAGCCSAGSCPTPTARRSTSVPSCCPPATTPSTTCGTPSGCAAPAATTSSSTRRSCPTTAR